MKRIYRTSLHIVLALMSWLSLSGATLPTGFTEKRLARGLDPTGVTALPDGRVLVTIKSGKILLVKNDAVLATPLLTIPNLDNWNERGLLCAILDPAFATNGYIYVYYTYKNPSTNVSNNRVSRFTVTGDVADPASQLVLINFNNLSSVGWHNGGGLVYGADGKIYASTGENANTSNAQSLNTLLGKVLRINPDGSIPTDNPFYNQTTGANRAIYAFGLRNPWRLKINAAGKIYMNEVGAGSWEEINEVKAGRNYGWPMIEGKRTNQTAPENYEDPLYAYNHDAACSITGGTFYNPTVQQFPLTYKDKYFFMDYCSGWIRYIDPTNNFAMSPFATGIDRPLDMAVDNEGNLYYLARGGIGGGSDADNTSSTEGELWKVSYTGSGIVNIGVNPVDKSVAVGAQVTFVVSATGQAPLSYQWQRNGVDIDGATSSSYTLSSVKLTDNNATFSVVVSNSISTKTSTTATLKVFTNTAPVPVITTPLATDLYEAGKTISFGGTATDAEDGELPASAFTWTIRFHHDIHYHPGLDPVSGIKSGTYDVPDEGEVSDTVWYRIILTVKDALGTTTTVTRDIYPKKVNVTLNTVPAGIPLFLDGAEQASPLTFKGVVGLKRTLEAKKSVNLGGKTYSFLKWSNEGSAFQTISTPTATSTYTATYVTSSFDSNTTVADAYVRGGANATTAYGSTDAAQLQTKTEVSAEITRRSYLRFDISKASNVIGARLRLFGGTNSTETSAIKVGVYGVSNATWDETALTWNNKPAPDTTMLDEATVNVLYTAGKYFDWDVSEYVTKAKQAGNATVSFLVSNVENTISYVRFNSKEAASDKPQLVLTLASEPLSTSMEEQHMEMLSLFPNPFSSEFSLRAGGQFEYSVYDLLGTLMLNGKAQQSAQIGSSLPSGTYVVKINTTGGSQIGKVVKL